MSKMADCGNVNRTSGCRHVIQGETEDFLLRLAAQHASQDHNMGATPELSQVKANIETR